MQTKTKRRWQAVLATMLAMLMLVCFSTGITAQSAWPREDKDGIHTSRFENIPVTVAGGAYISDCYLINETTYAPLRSFCDALIDCRVSFDDATRTATVSSSNLYLTARDGAPYITANGRYLYTDTPVKILDDGRMYIPVRLLGRAFGVNIGWNSASRSVTVSGKVTPILSGDKFYDADTVYWLSRIISAESRGEPLLGQIAVGNVVLNRVKCPDYPNTVWGVIFDRKFGTQFSPVLNGTVYRDPYWLSVVAAKLCLEGVTVSEDVLFFYQPNLATSFWIPENRPYAFKIGNHYFFY